MNSNKQTDSNLSREKIRQYHSSKEEKVKHEIEKDALENDFDADALEGWDALSSAGYSMKKLDKRFLPRNYFAILGIAFAVGLFITGIYFVYAVTGSATEKQNSHISKNSQIKVEKTDVVIPTNIEALVELPKKEQIVAKTIIQDFNQQKSTQSKYIEQVKSIDIDPLPISKIEINDNTPIAIAKERFQGKEIYLHDMKLLDYRAYRSKPKIASKQMILTGTPANIGETSDITETSEWKNIEIPYIDYLTKTMELFSKGNNKKALTRFQVILATYPDDVNANFYAGLCYYNLKEYLSAIHSLEKCLDSKYINFKEESEWYMVKSYIANNDKSTAIELLEKIITNNGYYSIQAKKLISSL
jgi:tetratricopeptide (TPR) repeat protein